MYCIRKRDVKSQAWIYLCYVPVYSAVGNIIGEGIDWRILSPMTRGKLTDFENTRVGEITKHLTSECQLVKLENDNECETPIVRLDHSFKLK